MLDLVPINVFLLKKKCHNGFKNDSYLKDLGIKCFQNNNSL